MKKYSIREIVPHYQPIVGISDHIPIMYEYLARFIDHNGHSIGPSDLTHLFENNEFLWELLGKTMPGVLTQICSGTILSINVMASVVGKRFFEMIERFAKEFPFAPEAIYFELSEKNIGRISIPIADCVAQIKNSGYGVILDDYGHGLALENRLKTAKFDMVKISGKLLIESVLSKSGEDNLRRVAEDIVSRGVPAIGKHIENYKIAEVAKRCGVKYGQGYFFGAPSPAIKNDGRLFQNEGIA